jgi:hypothetical protein
MQQWHCCLFQVLSQQWRLQAFAYAVPGARCKSMHVWLAHYTQRLAQILKLVDSLGYLSSPNQPFFGLDTTRSRVGFVCFTCKL